MSINFPVGTHRWQIEDICNMLEEHPEYETMSDEELKKKANELWWEASGYFDKANLIESDADTIELFIKIRKQAQEV